MANTYVDYIVGASQTDFAFSFPYLDDTHVVVQLDDSTGASPGGKFYTVSTGDYSIITSPSALIRFSSAPETGARIRIKRDSASDTALVDFENGSVLTEVELDRAYLHNLYLSEEIEEGSGKNTMTKDPVDGNYDADLAKIKNLADPTNPQDAVTKNYADTTFVDVAGDSMTGDLAMGANNITGVSSVQGLADPSGDNHAARKLYVDQQDALQVTKTGDSMSGALDLGDNKITSLDTPTVASDAANKSYVDSNIASTLATGVAGGQIDTVNIADDAITGDKIADNAIGTNHLGVDVIVAEDIANNAITVAELADNAVTAAKINSTDPDFNVKANGQVGVGTAGLIVAGKTFTAEDETIFDTVGGATAEVDLNYTAEGGMYLVTASRHTSPSLAPTFETGYVVSNGEGNTINYFQVLNGANVTISIDSTLNASKVIATNNAINARVYLKILRLS